MTDQELNMKLAKWRWPDAQVYIPRHFPVEIRVRVNGQTIHQIDLFTHSTDACFEWLVPKTHTRLGDEGLYDLLIRWVRDVIFGKEPALTLCEAIEQLIYKETNEK